MPIYEVRSLDVLGNPIDGYEINDTRRLGEIYLTVVDQVWMGQADGYDLYVVEQLVARKWLSVLAPRATTAGELIVETPDDFIQVSEYEGPAGINPHARPLLQLEPQLFTGPGPDSTDGHSAFWRVAFEVPASPGNMTPDVHDLRVEAYFAAGRIGFEVAVMNALPPRPRQTSADALDRFEWFLSDWQERPTLGFDPLTGKELTPTQKSIEEILVALDAFMEK